LIEMRGAVALLTFNRPSKLNALSYALIDRLMAVLDRIEDDANVRAVVLTGAGDRAFSAGADIAEFSESVRFGPDIAVKDFVRRGQAMTARMESFPKPIIAAVNGIAFGGTQRLPRLAGRKRALECLLTGESFSPQRAVELGLVNRVVPHGQLLDAAFGLADRIARHSHLAVARVITAATRGLNVSIAEGLAIESEQFARMAATQDTRKALDAWLAARASR
jgi:enoyl-CoA hydratase/carnithine racemase